MSALVGSTLVAGTLCSVEASIGLFMEYYVIANNGSEVRRSQGTAPSTVVDRSTIVMTSGAVLRVIY